MISSRVSKLRELQSHDQIIEVLNLWNTAEDDIETISNKTLLPKREVELILLTYEATKLVNDKKDSQQNVKHNRRFVEIGGAYFDIDKIVCFRERVIEGYNTEIWMINNKEGWKTSDTVKDIIRKLNIDEEQ